MYTLLESEHPAAVEWTPLLDAMGTEQFEHALKRFLSTLAGPRGCATFFHEALGEPVTACNCVCRSDRGGGTCGAHLANGSPNWIRFQDGPWQVALAVKLPEEAPAATSPGFGRRLAGTGAVLAAILRKHIDAARGASRRREPLGCLRTIEQCLAECAQLPPREIEVCSRILYGISSAGIAIDLRICETTIKTYRKRAYQRLAIGSSRELLTWYLRIWAGWHSAKERRQEPARIDRLPPAGAPGREPAGELAL